MSHFSSGNISELYAESALSNFAQYADCPVKKFCGFLHSLQWQVRVVFFFNLPWHFPLKSISINNSQTASKLNKTLHGIK